MFGPFAGGASDQIYSPNLMTATQQKEGLPTEHIAALLSSVPPFLIALYLLGPMPAMAYWTLFLLLSTSSAIDIQTYNIPAAITRYGLFYGIVFAFLVPSIVGASGNFAGLAMGIAGAGAGFMGGKALQLLLDNKIPRFFGFDTPASFKLQNSDFVVAWLSRGEGGLVAQSHNIAFADIVQRRHDKMIIQCRKVAVNGINVIGSDLVFDSDSATFNGKTVPLDSIKKCEGDIYGITTPAKSRLGFGDVKLLALAGAFLGWQGAFFVVFVSIFIVLCFTALKGLGGKPALKVAFAPYITFSAVFWMFGQPVLAPLLKLHI